jgi:superfamily I DNA and/or RNA helicase
VIFLLSHTHPQSLSNHIGFLLTRRRLNVGISRAKSLCILISSRAVLNPGIEVLANPDTRDGLEFLRAYEDRAWSADIDLNV